MYTFNFLYPIKIQPGKNWTQYNEHRVLTFEEGGDRDCIVGDVFKGEHVGVGYLVQRQDVLSMLQIRFDPRIFVGCLFAYENFSRTRVFKSSDAAF